MVGTQKKSKHQKGLFKQDILKKQREQNSLFFKKCNAITVHLGDPEFSYNKHEASTPYLT